MALNPDDLLIFRAREEEEKAEEEKKARKGATQKQVQQNSQQAQPRRQLFQKQESKSQSAVEEAVERSILNTEGEQKEDYYLAPLPGAGSVAPAQDYSETAAAASGFSTGKTGKAKANKKADPRKLASHMNCELHPWRRAYAICDYCKRAFCYEDVIEVGGKYYDLDDIDKVPAATRRSQMVKYGNLALLSSILYMAAFLVFIYYSYSPVITLFSDIAKIGIPVFINDITVNIILLLAETLLGALAILSGITIMLNSRNSFRISAIGSIFGVAIFSYQYVNYGKIYFIAFAAMVFVAFVTLAYSRVSYETLPEEDTVFEREPAFGPARSNL